MTPDINVLLGASRTDHPQHRPARRWLTRAITACEAGGTIGILPMVGAGFLRLATHPRVFVVPTPLAAATEFLDSLLSIAGVDMQELGREWPTFRQLCRDRELAANAITDAWIAAAVRTSGGHLVTFDRDFLRLLGRTELTILEPE